MARSFTVLYFDLLVSVGYFADSTASVVFSIPMLAVGTGSTVWQLEPQLVGSQHPSNTDRIILIRRQRGGTPSVYKARAAGDLVSIMLDTRASPRPASSEKQGPL